MSVWSTRNLEYSAERFFFFFEGGGTSVDGNLGLLKITVTALLRGQGLPASLPADHRFSLVFNGEPWSVKDRDPIHHFQEKPRHGCLRIHHDAHGPIRLVFRAAIGLLRWTSRGNTLRWI